MNEDLEQLLVLFCKGKEFGGKEIHKYFSLKIKCEQALRLQEIVKEKIKEVRMNYDADDDIHDEKSICLRCTDLVLEDLIKESEEIK